MIAAAAQKLREFIDEVKSGVGLALADLLPGLNRSSLSTIL
jgi:hypothetical protein